MPNPWNRWPKHRAILDRWRGDYHHVRPHSSLRDAVPADWRRARAGEGCRHAHAASTEPDGQHRPPTLTPRAAAAVCMDADAPPNERLSREPNRIPILLTETRDRGRLGCAVESRRARARSGRCKAYTIQPHRLKDSPCRAFSLSERLCTTTASREEISWASL